MKIKVHVTQNDIDLATTLQGAGSPASAACPIACSLSRVFGESTAVRVRYRDMYVLPDEYAPSRVRDVYAGKRFLLPDRAQHFISDFDAGLPVGPIIFTAPAVDVSERKFLTREV